MRRAKAELSALTTKIVSHKMEDDFENENFITSTKKSGK